jgi:predicted transcriptional regulator
MYSQEVATKAKDIHKLTHNHQITSAVLKEVSETNKYYTAVSLENEFNVLDKLQRGLDIRETTNDNGLSETDRKIKKDVRKIASERVNAVSKLTGVDKSCLADFCKKDKAKQAQILSKAKSKLNPKLNKMRTRNIDKINNDIEKFNNPENDDKQNNQDFQFGY